MRQFLQSIDKWSVQYLSNSSKLLDSTELITPNTQTMKGGANNLSSISYNMTGNNFANKSLNSKNNIRSRKTFSYKHFMGNSSGKNNILR